MLQQGLFVVRYTMQQEKPLVENTVKQVVAFTRSNKMTATDLKDISNKLLNYVSVTSPELTDRQIADYYLADPATYKKTIEGLPKDKRFDSDGNLLSESELYNMLLRVLLPTK